MEKNVKDLSSKQKNHIDIWYLFITYILNKGEVSTVWCPTRDMIGYYMNKPPQGAMFWKFRDQIMGVNPDAYLVTGKVKVEQLKKV